MKALAVLILLTVFNSQNIFAMGSTSLNCVSSDKKIIINDENGFSNIEVYGKKLEASIENYSLDLKLSNKVFWKSKNIILASENLSNDCGVHHEKEEFQNVVNIMTSDNITLTTSVICKEEVIISALDEQYGFESCN